jgi:predicted enzyme related to lactoylglutathione lyase
MWVRDRHPVDNPGTEVHIMVGNADATERAIVEKGGTLVWRSGANEPEVYGTFRDPSGNLFGYYQRAGLED